MAAGITGASGCSFHHASSTATQQDGPLAGDLLAHFVGKVSERIVAGAGADDSDCEPLVGHNAMVS